MSGVAPRNPSSGTGLGKIILDSISSRSYGSRNSMYASPRDFLYSWSSIDARWIIEFRTRGKFLVFPRFERRRQGIDDQWETSAKIFFECLESRDLQNVSKSGQHVLRFASFMSFWRNREDSPPLLIRKILCWNREIICNSFSFRFMPWDFTFQQREILFDEKILFILRLWKDTTSKIQILWFRKISEHSWMIIWSRTDWKLFKTMPAKC